MQNQIAYVNGQPEGNYTVYYRNGKIEEQGTWIDGMNVGEFKRFYENGNPQQEFTFLESGKRNGVQKYYYENGQLELEANFKQGNEEGAFVRYNENGTVKERMEMSNGSVKAGTQKKYSRTTNNQTVKADSDAKEAPKATDKTNKSYEFDPNGYNTLYNRDLQKTQVGDFRNGKLWDGKWYRYDESGILEKIEIYKDTVKYTSWK